MSLISRLVQGLTGTGAHRAADRIPELEADRDYWQAVALEAQAKLDHADRLVKKVCREKAAGRFENARLTAELDAFKQGHELLSINYDELAARFTAVSAALANAHAVSSPAPADHRPAIVLHDPDSTAEINVTTLWNGLGLRPNTRAKTAA